MKTAGTLSLHSARRGRPRAFDADDALDRAMRVFWRHGYEGASMPQLTRAMGINRPSLYAAFGNKEALFRKALDRYVELGGRMWNDAMSHPTARQSVERLLRGILERAGRGQIRGCLLVQGALACGDEAEPIRLELARRRGGGELMLRKRFERAIAEGDLPADTDPAALAKFVATVVHGIAVQLSGGAGQAELSAVVEMALQAIPQSSRA